MNIQMIIVVLFTVNVIGCAFNLIIAQGADKLGWFSALLAWSLLLLNKLT